MKALYKTHSSYPEAQGQFQQVTDNAKKNSLVQSFSIKSWTISSTTTTVSLAYKTCYSPFSACIHVFHRMQKKQNLTSKQATSPGAQT